MRRKKIADSDVVKLLAVVSLQGENGTTELCGDIGIKSGECGKSVGLATKRKCPHIMSKIIQYHQIV